MKIAIGSLQCESNTLSPIPTLEADFDRAYGRDMFEKVNVIDMLEAAGAEIVPTLYAHALPGGAVAPRSILAFTPGGSTERLEDMHHKNISRPMYPLDDDFI